MLLEREHEATALAALLDEVRSGGRVVLVRGEAGVGKSALVQHVAEHAAERAHVLMGACDDLHTPQPLGPIWDIARRHPPLRRPLEGGDPRAVMEHLLETLTRPDRPTLLVIEDSQWADEATLDVVKFLGRRIARTTGVLLLTYRDGDVDDEHPLRVLLGQLRPSDVVRFGLAPLSADAVATMVGDARFDVDVVMGLTGGNPLFVAEVLASGTEAVPSSVQDAVLARATRLSASARALLKQVSVLPGGGDRELVERLTGVRGDGLADCERRNLLTPSTDRVAFCHELQRRAVEASLTMEERRRLNQRVVDALGDDSRSSPRLVHHAREAGDVDALVRHAPRAARAAAAMGSHREAVAHYRALDPHLGRVDPVPRAELLVDWTVAEMFAGGPQAVDVAQRAVASCREVGDDLLLARALVRAARVLESNSRPDQAQAAADQAVAILESRRAGGDLAMALAERAWIDFVRGQDDPASVILADRAIEIAKLVGDELVLTRATTLKGAIRHNMGQDDGMPLVEQAAARAARDGHRFEEVQALVNLAGMNGDVRDVARAADLARRARDTAARYEMTDWETYASAMYAEILLWQGDWDAAEDAATAVLDTDSLHSHVIAWRLLALLQVRRGRAEAPATLERMWGLAEPTRELQYLDPAAGVLAEARWLGALDDPGQLERLRRVAEMGRRAGPPWPSGMLAFWLWELGEHPGLPAHVPTQFRAIAEGDPGSAATFWRSRGLPYEEGMALMHGDQAARLQAIEVFEGLGASAAADRVRRDLRESGTPVPRGRSRTTRDHTAGLTARQAEVLGLLAEGLANAEIADRLFLSPRTVENHVAAVLMKLDVPDRHAAVEVARGRGLL